MDNALLDKPMTKANDNIWYCLATLYGEPDHTGTKEDLELQDRNRSAWNRYMYDKLTEAQKKNYWSTHEPSPDTLMMTMQHDIYYINEINSYLRTRCKNYHEYYGTIKINDDEISFKNTEFSKPFYCSDFIFPLDAPFDGAKFSSEAHFERAAFYGTALFNSATFSDHANFDGANFSCQANFDQATFCKDTSFKGANISQTAIFNGATFSGQTNFNGLTFSELAQFKKATFLEQPNFQGTTFRSLAYFEETVFSKQADFVGAHFNGGTNFNGATFFGQTNFNGLTFLGLAQFRKATFSGPADFSHATFSFPTFFGNAVFSKIAEFEDATFSSNSFFKKVTFTKEVNFQGATFTGSAHFQDATFKSVPSFINAKMKGLTYFENVTFSIPPRFYNAKLHEGTVWLGTQWPVPTSPDDAADFISAYERLKLEMDRLKKHEDEIDFFALELQSRRVRAGRFRGLPIALYGLLSDYGRSYFRPLAWLLGTAIAGAIALLPHFGLSNYGAALGLSFANTFGILGFRKDFIDHDIIEHLSRALKVLAATQTVMGFALIFLLGLAVRNHFRMK